MKVGQIIMQHRNLYVH